MTGIHRSMVNSNHKGPGMWSCCSCWTHSRVGCDWDTLWIMWHPRNAAVEAAECTVHYDDVIMTQLASQITSLTVVYSAVYSDADQRKHQSSASLAFVWGIHRDRWIPRTKGQLRGKCFHLMTSSCELSMFWNPMYIIWHHCNAFIGFCPNK